LLICISHVSQRCTLYTCTLCTVYFVHGVLCARCTLCTVYFVHGVLCTRCTLYTVYFVHGVLCTLVVVVVVVVLSTPFDTVSLRAWGGGQRCVFRALAAFDTVSFPACVFTLSACRRCDLLFVLLQPLTLSACRLALDAAIVFIQLRFARLFVREPLTLSACACSAAQVLCLRLLLCLWLCSLTLCSLEFLCCCERLCCSAHFHCCVRLHRCRL